jgi:hypothetical protein
VEELGSVYESLLDFQPVIKTHSEGLTFTLATGSERKSTGSYYTRPELVRELIESALVPVLEDRLKQAKDATKGNDALPQSVAKEQAILSMTVCDPACGSGHFLLAAARRLGRELARVRTGEDEPTPEQFHLAVRDVISHCIYGVDANPLAVDLCKLALWLEGHWTGKPLNFLDHRIKCGNSLIGVLDSRVLEDGIPDAAFTPVTGDDKEVAKAFKKRNKEERKGQYSLTFEPAKDVQRFAASSHELDSIAEETPADVKRKQQKYEEWRSKPDWWHDWTACNIWTAAFFVPLTKYDDPKVPTHDRFLRFIERRDSQPQMAAAANALSEQLHFFHWRMEFPQVFEQGGFDVVLGNPPWDTLSPDAKEFFSNYDPGVRFLSPDERDQKVEQLLRDPAISREWEAWCRYLYTTVRFIKQSGRYQLFAPGNLGKGDFNVYRMFVETAMETTRVGGSFGQVVPEGFYNGANSMAIRKTLFDTFTVTHVFGFENAREVWFDGIDSRAKFCIYSASKCGDTTEIDTAFNIRTIDSLNKVRSGAVLRLPISLVAEFSPTALAMMEFQQQAEIEICRKIYAGWPKFGERSESTTIRSYMREIDMGNDRGLFRSDSEGLPVYEGRMVDISTTEPRAICPGGVGQQNGKSFRFHDMENLFDLSGTFLHEICLRKS